MIAWYRPAVAPDAPFCAIVCHDGRSVVTACNGRWERSVDDETAQNPPAGERCGGCRRELEMQARDVALPRSVHASLRDGRSFMDACGEARERMTAAGIVYPGAALCEEDADGCHMRGLLASIGVWLRTMDEAELRRVDACVVEILRGRE